MNELRSEPKKSSQAPMNFAYSSADITDVSTAMTHSDSRRLRQMLWRAKGTVATTPTADF